MRVLTLNCGSSSIKSAVIETDDERRLADLRIENIGEAGCRLHVDGRARDLDASTNFEAAVSLCLAEVRGRSGVLGNLDAVAHRVVHGGERFVQATRIDEQTLSAIGELDHLAPLHNPPALAAVRIARRALPELPHVAMFDTAFHATLPKRAREYALPVELAKRFGIRRFGFHGLSHAHVSSAVAAHLRVTPHDLRIISCHLGNGASVAAIEYGRSVETSMGMTPLEGLVMGTRSGDVDPGVLLQLLQSREFDAERLEKMLNSQSGLKGLTGTNDLRDIERRAAEGDESCRLAITVYAHRVRKYVGAYAAVMGGVDVIAFTGGVGENSALMRHRIAQRFDFLGAALDEDSNRDARVGAKQAVFDVATEESRVRLLVVSADEELQLAIGVARALAAPASRQAPRIPAAISARHAHLSQATIDRLFGPGHRLQQHSALSQHGQFAAEEQISLIGPRGRIDHVRVLGPPRAEDQIEISRSDEFVLGLDAPVRISGDLRNSPGVALEGPRGQITIPCGVICAKRHIHMNPTEAAQFRLADHDVVAVRFHSDGRELVFGDVVVRVSPEFALELHLDTDEANAAGVKHGDLGELIRL